MTNHIRITSWLSLHKLDVIILSIVILLVGVVSQANMSKSPQRFEDEGTYVSQAISIKDEGSLSHYTYWYDHPPAAWIQIAGYFTLTGALDRHDSAIGAGREFMLLLHIATIGLLYALTRRLSVGPIATGVGTLLYGLSPLVVEFSRYVLLDNVALPWVLGAFLLALSPKRSIKTAALSAVCIAIGILSKETFAVLLPVLLYAIWGNSDVRNRRYTMTVFLVILVLASLQYPLYAALKGELIPGDGHVSLIGTLWWQLSGRAGSGSLLDVGSDARGLFEYWLRLDMWLLLAGIVSLPVAIKHKKMRIPAFSLIIGAFLLFRGGYLPFPLVIMLLPFSAVLFAGALQMAMDNLQLRSFLRLCSAQVFFFIIVGLLVFKVIPDWQIKTTAFKSQDQDYSSRQAVIWVTENVDRGSRIVVEPALWTDLQTNGFVKPEPVWFYKTETDPAVVAAIGGWEGIDYVVLNVTTIGRKDFNSDFPTVAVAIDKAELVEEFGTNNQKVLIYKVQAR